MAIIEEVINPLTAPPAVPVIADGQETFNTRVSAWLSFWKNNIYVEIGTFVEKLNLFNSQLLTVTEEINDSVTDMGQLKQDVSDLKSVTQTIKDGTNTLRNETLAYIDATFGTDGIWSYIDVVSSTYTASSFQIVRVDATAQGADVEITLPATPEHRDMVEVMNVDFEMNNIFTLKRGDALHRIDGELEDSIINKAVSVTFVFDMASANWLVKG